MGKQELINELLRYKANQKNLESILFDIDEYCTKASNGAKPIVSGALCHSCNANIAEEFIPKCYCPECGNEWHNDR